jgi:TonB family protein
MMWLVSVLVVALGAGQSSELDEALRQEVRAKKYRAAEKLLENPAVDPDAQDEDGWTALMYAARTDNPNMLVLLLKAGVDRNLVNHDGETALIVAAKHGNVEAARQLLMAGADIDPKDAKGRTALAWAEADDRTYLSQIIRIASRPSLVKVTVAEKPVNVGDEVLEPPRVLKETPPLYTERAFDRGIEGRVVLKVIIRRDGSVIPVRVQESLDRDLDDAAMQAIRTWQFDPAKVQGEPINVLTDIEFQFSIQRKKS